MSIILNEKNTESVSNYIALAVNKISSFKFIDCIYAVSFIKNGELFIEITAVDSRFFITSDKDLNNTMMSLEKYADDLLNESQVHVKFSFVRSNYLRENFMSGIGYEEEIYAKDLKSSTILYDKNGEYKKLRNAFIQNNEIQEHNNLINIDSLVYKMN